MDNRLTNLSHPAVAAQSRNKTAIAGTCTMNTVLAAAYIAEVLKGVRSLPSYLIFFCSVCCPVSHPFLPTQSRRIPLVCAISAAAALPFCMPM